MKSVTVVKKERMKKSQDLELDVVKQLEKSAEDLKAGRVKRVR